MKQNIVVILTLVSSFIFANNMVLIEQIEEAKVELQIEAKQIGRDAFKRFGSDNNASKGYIGEACKEMLVDFDYLEDKNITEHILLPECREFALDAITKE